MTASAQGIGEPEVSATGHFFISIIAGVIIAVGVQFILSNLAIAAGISAIGDISQSGTESADTNSSSVSGKKVISGLGLFSTVTMSVSLIAGTWLALDLIAAPSILNGAIAGLVIWAFFFLICFYFDIKFTTRVTGSLYSFIQSSLSKTSTTLSGIFTSSTPKPEDFAQKTIQAIHKEIRQEFDTSDIDKKIKSYIDRASNDFSAKDIRKELENLLHEIEIEEQYTTDDPDAARKLILEVANKQSNINSKDKQKISDTISELKKANKDGDNNKQKVVSAFDKLSPGEEEQGQVYREKLIEYLNTMDRDEVSVEELEADLDKLLNDPSQTQQVISQRISQIDRETIKAAVASHSSMDERKADKVLQAFDSIVAKLGGKQAELKDKAQKTKSDDTQPTTTNLPAKRSKVEQRIQQWFDRTGRSELAYRDIKADFMEMLDNPKIAPEVLGKRVKNMNEQTVRALLTNNDRLNDEDIEHYLEQYKSARAELTEKLNLYQKEASERINTLKKGAMQQAENARVLAASAAWWLFVSAIVSGAAATVAGALATNII